MQIKILWSTSVATSSGSMAVLLKFTEPLQNFKGPPKINGSDIWYISFPCTEENFKKCIHGVKKRAEAWNGLV